MTCLYCSKTSASRKSITTVKIPNFLGFIHNAIMPPTKTQTQWKDIPPVPSSQEFLDIVLSRTQRRLPTQIVRLPPPPPPSLGTLNANAPCSCASACRIQDLSYSWLLYKEGQVYSRNMYARLSKQRYRKTLTATVSEKINSILETFPRINEIHPFHKDLCVLHSTLSLRPLPSCSGYGRRF